MFFCFAKHHPGSARQKCTQPGKTNLADLCIEVIINRKIGAAAPSALERRALGRLKSLAKGLIAAVVPADIGPLSNPAKSKSTSLSHHIQSWAKRRSLGCEIFLLGTACLLPSKTGPPFSPSLKSSDYEGGKM